MLGKTFTVNLKAARGWILFSEMNNSMRIRFFVLFIDYLHLPPSTTFKGDYQKIRTLSIQCIRK